MRRFVIAILLTSLSVSCTKEAAAPDSEDLEEITITVGNDGVKTYLKDMVAEWGSGAQDKVITVFDSGNTNRPFSNQDVSGAAATRSFSGKIAAGSSVKYILWPQDNSARVSGSYIYTTVTNSQVPSNLNSFSTGSNVVICKGGESSLHNMLGYLRFTIPVIEGRGGETIPPAAISSVVFSTNTEGEYLAGDAVIDYSGDLPVISPDASGTRKYASITSGPRVSKSVKQASTYYLAVFPGVYHGITATITPVGGAAFNYSSGNTLTVLPGKYTELGTLPIAPPSPEKIFGTSEKINSSTSANALFLDGNILYMGDSGHVYVYDLSKNRAIPTLLSTITLPGLVRQITAGNGILYTANRETGSYIFNVSDPASPKLVKRYDPVELATGIDVAGDLLCISQRQNGVEFVDVSNPAAAAHIDIIRTSESQSCFYKDGFVYSGEWGKGEISVIDVRNLSDIKIVRKVLLQGYGDGVYASGNLLFASTGHHHLNSAAKTVDGDGHGLEIFDITAPDDPKFLSRVEFDTFFASGNDYWTCRLSGDGKTLYCADTGNGAYAVDISVPSHPVILGRFQSPLEQPVTSIAVSEGYVYVSAGKDGLYSVKSPKAKAFTRDMGALPTGVGARKDYATPVTSAFSAWVPAVRCQVHSAAAYGDALFVACGDGGLSIVKRNGSGDLYQYAKGPSEFAGDVKVRGNRLYVSEGTDGLAVYTIGSGPSLSLLKRVGMVSSGDAYNIALWVFAPNDKFVVVGTRYGGYSFFGVGGTETDPTYTYRTRKNWYVAYNKFISDEVCAGDQLPFITKQGLVWIDLGNAAAAPSVAGPYDNMVTSLSEGICNFKDGGALYVHNRTLNYVSSKGTEVGKSSASSSNIFGIPRWDGDDRVLMSATTARKLSVVNVSSFPSVSSEIYEDTSGQPEAGIFWNGKAVVPCGYQGLLVEK